MFPLPFEALRI